MARKKSLAGNSHGSARRGRGPGRPFPKGQSGNPSGRPPLSPEYKVAVEDVGKRSLQGLSNIIDDPTHVNYFQALIAGLNRWKGTPTSKSEIGGPGGGPIPFKTVLTSDEKRARFRQLAEKAAALEAARLVADAAEEERGNSD